MSSLQLLRNPSENSIEFLVTRDPNWSEYNKAIVSDIYLIGCIKFQIKVRFSNSKMFLTLSISQLQKNEVFYQGALIDLSIVCFYHSLIIDQQKNMNRTICFPHASWDLGEYKTFSSWLNTSQITLRLTFEFMYPFNLNSSLVFSFTEPSKTPFFRYLNNKEASDCCFQLKNNQELWVRKDIITFECSYFQKLLLGDRAINFNDKIASPWGDKLFICCILHLYTGWLPGSPICNEVFERLNLTRSSLKLDSAFLSELYELAKNIELQSLAYFSLKQVQNLAKQYQASLINNLIKMEIL
ncbi:hypothetical protein HMI55_006326 [Coelomomyces lativittatus]|nr:hypothetical protein HMI55_006326 [Coelomomyces lativittatus]